jgi:hypothetical protein
MLPEASDYNKNNFLVELFLQKNRYFLRGQIHTLRAFNVQLNIDNIITVTAQ